MYTEDQFNQLKVIHKTAASLAHTSHQERCIHYGTSISGTEVTIKAVIAAKEDEETPGQFRKEVETWYNLRDPHVLPLYGANDVGSPMVFVCGRTECGNFNDYFSTHRHRFWQVFLGAARGLAYLHKQKRVHGNLKCNNLLVTKHGVGVLSDFMFAFVRINSALSVEEKAPDYFWKAPKCYTLEGSNPRTPRPESDVYALGMCIFEAMCGEKPFEGVKEQAAIDKIRKGELPNRPDNKITDETWNLIAKMCCRNFQDRIRLDIVIAELQVLAGPCQYIKSKHQSSHKVRSYLATYNDVCSSQSSCTTPQFIMTARDCQASQPTQVIKVRYRLPLLIMTLLSGCVFTYAVLDIPTLEFHHLHPSVFPESSVQLHRGFASVLRWLESLNTREDLVILEQLLTQARLQPRSSTDPSVKALPNFASQAATAASTETILHIAKLGLQCALVLFLYQRRTLSKKQTIPTMCLCILSLLCWKMAQTCVYEILTPFRSNSTELATQTRALTQDSRNEIKASFLNALFVARYSSMCITNLILGRAYQVYFCEPWPTHWKRVPAYLGSKNLVLSTLFFATTTVSAISVASPPLRSLCEAATHIETLALAITFGHFVILHFFLDKDDGSKLRSHSHKAAAAAASAAPDDLNAYTVH